MKPYLMIIDDSADQVELMKAVFAMVDPSLEIVAAEDGETALKMLRSGERPLPRVILLDLRLPRATGHEVLAVLKRDPHLKKVPVCTFSSSDNPKDIYLAYDAGASFYFKKPIGLDNLIKFVETFKLLWFDFASVLY